MANKYIKEVFQFLEMNGLEKINENSYKNDKCTVIVTDDHYEIVSIIEGGQDIGLYRMHSDDLNIYWLIGVLTYYRYIDRDYKN